MNRELVEFYDWLMERQKELFPEINMPVLPDISGVIIPRSVVVEDVSPEQGDPSNDTGVNSDADYETVFVVVDQSSNKIASLFGVTDNDGQKLHVQADAKWQVPNGSYIKLMDLPNSGKPFILLASEIMDIGISGYSGPDIGEKDLINGRKLPGDIGWYGRAHITYGNNKDKSPQGIIFNDSNTWLTVKKVKKNTLPEWWFD